MKTKTKLNVIGSLLALGGCLALTPVAQAIPFNGTDGFVPVGDTTFTGGTLGSATSVTVPAAEIINTLPVLFNGLPNNFIFPLAESLGNLVSLSPLTLTPGGSETVTFLSGAVATFTGISFSSSGPGDLHMSATGTLTAPGFDPTPSSFSASFTETGIGGAIDGSFTVAAPPIPTGVPEAGTMLVSLAPLGFLFLARFRKQS